MAFNNNNEIFEDVLFGNPNSNTNSVAGGNFTNYSDMVEEPIFNVNNANSSSNNSHFVIESLDFDEPTLQPVDSVGEEALVREEAPAIEVPKTPSVVTPELSALATPVVQKPKYIEKNFAKKLLEADYDIIKRYDELKNYILKFKGIKSRISNDFDSFNMGRTQLFKLGYSTQSLKLFLNLDYDKVEPRLKCKDAGHKKAYAEVPVFLRIKSPRAMRNAVYLINQVIERFGIKEDPKAVTIDSVKLLRTKAKVYK